MNLRRYRSVLLVLTLIVAASYFPSSTARGDEPTLDQLKVELRDQDPKVRKKAAQQLGATRSREAVPPLLAAASDPDVEVREEVVKALGLLKDESAITMLLTTLKDRSDSVREESIIALVNLYADRDAGFSITRIAKKVYRKINVFSDKVGNDPLVIESYVRVAPAVIDGLSDRLFDSSMAIRVGAAKALGILRAKPALPRMIEAMKTGDSNVRVAILRSLYKIRDASVDSEILIYLNDQDKGVRDETILTLGLLRSTAALPAIRRLYDENPDTKLRLRAFQAISLIGDPSSLDLFRRLLKDPDAIYRQYAAEGMARVGDPIDVEDVSRAFLGEKKFNVQLALSYALYRMGRQEYLDRLVSGLSERMHYEQAGSYLIELGQPVSGELTRHLNHPDARVRVQLCRVLGLIGDSSAIPHLKPLLQDSNKDVISEAALAIRRLGAS
ncbi:MAG: HEAT repeat domain-containing protein [Acidobacteriota bacterium]